MSEGWIVAALLALALVGVLFRQRAERARLGGVEALAADRGAGEGTIAQRLAAALDAVEAMLVAEQEAGQVRTERLLRVADAAPNGWVVVDAEGRVERLNRAALALLGLKEAPVGRTPLEGLHAPAVIDALDEARRTGASTTAVDFAHGDLDLSVSAHPLPGGVLAVVRDVGNERAVERARTDFVANVSHELRTPIAAILGYAETLLDTPGGLPDDVELMVRTVHRNAVRLRNLFDDLLTLYKLEARRRTPPLQRVDVVELVRGALTTTRDAAATKEITVELVAPEVLPADASPEALATIVANLAGNAVKYTPPGGRITVDVEGDEQEVRVRVQDTGVGIARAHHARIFERFYRVDAGRSRDAGGTGLGLAIVKHLADAAGCRVTVESEEGQGAAFTVHLRRFAEARPGITWDVTLDPRGDERARGR